MNINEAFVSSPRKARVEIIPLIDVIFFLLATFVLFTLSLNKIASLSTTLPKGSESPPGEDRTAYIQTSEAGTLYWKLGDARAPELIAATDLPARLADYRKHEAAPRVLIRGDNQAKFGATVLVLDEVRKAGITQVSVETLVTPTGK